MRKTKAKKKKYVWVFFLSLFLTIVSFALALHCFEIQHGAKELLASYHYDGKVDYEVELKENPYYEENSFSDELYLSSLIDKIKLNFRYENSSSNPMQVQYTYDVVGKIISSYKYNEQEKNLWEKDYEFVPKTEVVGKSIHEEIELTYDDYNEIAKEFQKEQSVVLDSYFLVEMKIYSKATIGTDPMSYNDIGTIQVKIPLSRNVIAIEKKINNVENQNIYKNEINTPSFNYPLFIVSTIFLIASLVVCILIASSWIKADQKSEYQKMKKRILNRFGDIIAEINTVPEMKNVEVIEIKYFEDLVNIEEELRSPILLYEKESYQSIFLIFHENKAYQYTLAIEEKRK